MTTIFTFVDQNQVNLSDIVIKDEIYEEAGYILESFESKI